MYLYRMETNENPASETKNLKLHLKFRLKLQNDIAVVLNYLSVFECQKH